MPSPTSDPEPAGPDAVADDPEAQSEPEREWWDDPRLPWAGKPGRADIGCWAAFGITGVYALVLLPLRPVLLGANPYLLAALGGSNTSIVTIGALTAVGQGHPVLGLLLVVFGTLKFDWIYWWAGKLWGRGLIEIIAGRSARAARNAARAERLANRFGAVAVLATYVLPLPSAVVYAAVGAAGMRLRTFLLLDLVGAVALKSAYLYLGYRIGQPAIEVVKVIAQYSWYISIALLVGIIANAVWRAMKNRRAAASAPTDPE